MVKLPLLETNSTKYSDVPSSACTSSRNGKELWTVTSSRSIKERQESIATGGLRYRRAAVSLAAMIMTEDLIDTLRFQARAKLQSEPSFFYARSQHGIACFWLSVYHSRLLHVQCKGCTTRCSIFPPLHPSLDHFLRSAALHLPGGPECETCVSPSCKLSNDCIAPSKVPRRSAILEVQK